MDAHDGISIFSVWPSNVPLRARRSRGEGRGRSSPVSRADGVRGRAEACTDRRAPFGVRDGARGAGLPRAHLGAFRSFRDAAPVAGAGAAAGIARATPPQPTRGAVLFCSTRPRRRAARRRAAGARGGTGRGRETPRALSPRGAPTSRARVRRAQPRTAGACLPDGGRARREKHPSYPSGNAHWKRTDRGSSSTSDCASDLLVAIDARTLARSAPHPPSLAAHRKGAFARGSPPWRRRSAGSTPAARRTDPFAGRPRAARGTPARTRTPRTRAPGAGAGAYSPLLFGRGAAPRRRRPRPAPRPRPRSSARPRPAADPPLSTAARPPRERPACSAAASARPASASASGGEKDLRRGRQAPRRRPAQRRRRRRRRRRPRRRRASDPSPLAASTAEAARGSDPRAAANGAARDRRGSAPARWGWGGTRRRRRRRRATKGELRRPKGEPARGGSTRGRRGRTGAAAREEGRPRRRSAATRGTVRSTREEDARREDSGPSEPRMRRLDRGSVARAMRTVSPPPPPPPRPRGGFRRARGLGEDELVMQPRRTTWGKIVEFVIGPL